MIAPESVYQSNDVVPGLRELYSQHPVAMNAGAETLARLLFVLRFLNYQPDAAEVEAAVDALTIDGGVAA